MADDPKVPEEAKLLEDQNKNIIEVWKTVIGVQQHFNDIAMRIRSMFVTILLALFAAIGFMLDKKFSIHIAGATIQYVVLLPIFGIACAYLFYFIDRYWYHRLLVGSVNEAIRIEHLYRERIPSLGLSEAIGKESPYVPRPPTLWVARAVVSHKEFRDKGVMHSNAKIEFFYKSVMAGLLLLAVILWFISGVTPDPASSARTPIAPATSTSPKEPK